MTVLTPMNAAVRSPAAVLPESPTSRLATGATVIAVVAALHFGRDILIPLTLAGLLAFALEPLATRLRRIGLGRVPSVLLVVIMALTLLGGLGVMLGLQVVKLAENVPGYKANIEQKIRSLKVGSSGGTFDQASSALRELGKEISRTEQPPRPRMAPGRGPDTEAIRVQVEPAETSSLEVAKEVLGPVAGPAGLFGLVLVFLVFMLLEQEQLRDRMIRLFGGRDMSLTTQAMGEAAERVSRYLLMQLLVNASYGLPIGIGLYLIGVPNALLWGALAVVLRFIPYIGPFIAMLFPVALAIAVDPGWGMLGWVLALFVLVELVSNNVIEPWLYGASTGLSAVAIIVAAIFWTTLWGPAGLLLSTPITVCLVVLGRYVPALHFLHVLLGNAPALSPPERLYQRLLAGDTLEALEIAEEAAAEAGRPAFREQVALAALRHAEMDRRQNRLSPERAEQAGACLIEVLDQFDHTVEEGATPEERQAQKAAEGTPEDGGEARKPDQAPDEAHQRPVDERPVIWPGQPVYCVGARSALDVAAAALLARALVESGVGAQFMPSSLSRTANLRDVLADGAAQRRMVVLVQLTESGPSLSQQLVKRLRRYSRAPILIANLESGLLNDPSPALSSAGAGLPAIEKPAGADGVVASLSQALQWIGEKAREPIAASMMPAPTGAREEERLEALQRKQLLDTPRERAFDEVTRRLKEAFEVPIALISLVDEKRQFWKSSAGLPSELEQARESDRRTSVCGHVVAANEFLVVEDMLRDPRFANNQFLLEHGIRFYAGAPLSTEDGLALGAVCVMDVRPRSVSKAEQALLRLTAQQVMREIDVRTAALHPTAPSIL